MTVFNVTYRRWVNGQFDPLDREVNVLAWTSEGAAELVRESLRVEIEISRIVPGALVLFMQRA